MAEEMKMVDNLTNLTEMSEESVLGQLKFRYENKVVYTYVGDILIALNPYERLPLYTPEMQKIYLQPNLIKDETPPHAYMLATVSYEAMIRNKAKQCFVISGESGAGKSETTKIIVSHVMELCRSGAKALEETIKVVNPLLEAFGNSKTTMNDNSSRFGKYLELKFDVSGGVAGATMTHYLLEKSRVVTRNDNEQNYHIFYQMYSGLNQEGTLAKYGLTVPNKHTYLQGVGAPDDAKVFGQKFLDEWNELMEGMHFVGFEKPKIESMLKACAAILLIGDTSFKPVGDSGVEVVTEAGVMEKACQMIEVDPEALKNALRYTTLYTRGEATQKMFSLDQAKDARDALSKAIFNNIFMWVFDVCNAAMTDTKGSGLPTNTIGVLDIFGFEVFKINSIEQMCIDVTNEQLQHFFNHNIFEMEQVEYLREGIDVSKISYVDNQSTLDLFLKKQPQGIFNLLDDESKFPKGTDAGFAEKCVALKTHPSGAFTPAKSTTDITFTVMHYAGPVVYSCKNFLEKNRDTVPADVVAVMAATTSSYMQLIFTERPDPLAPPVKDGNKKVVSTLVTNFKKSLEELVATLSACNPSFVRCLKPNGIKKPSNWDVALVTRQLKYAGVLATITIRKMGYSFRLSFSDFVRRYKVMAFKFNENPEETKETCQKILTKIKMADYQVGSTKVFMKYFHGDYLATEAKKHSSALQFLQKVVKGNLARSRYDAALRERREYVRKVEAFCTFAEDVIGKCTTKMAAHAAEDVAEGGKRVWLKDLKTEVLQAEETKRVEQEEIAVALKIAEQQPKVVKSKVVNGYFIHMRNEHLTLKRGPLKPRYRKKLDVNSDRFYFKDIDLKTTSWIDPRSIETRKVDPLECVDDELPYGWDEAESEDGVKFYIDHVTNTHHKEHPRVAFQRRKNALDKEAAEQKIISDKKLEMINELRVKRRRLHTQMVSSIDVDERKDLASRIESLDDTIMAESQNLNSVQLASKKLAERFQRMRDQKKGTMDIDAVVQKLAGIWITRVLKRKPSFI